MTERLHPSAGKLQRIQRNVLADSERRLLIRMCARMPGWVTPDRLTAFGLFGAALVGVGYAASNWGTGWLLLTYLGYAMQWFGDSMDGSLARFRKIERPSYGYFIDHSCDALTILFILGGMGASPYVTMDVALFALVGYLMLSIHAYLSARVLGELKLSYLAAGPTELRFLLIGLTTMMMILGSGPGLFGTISGFDIFVGTVAAILVVLFVLQTLASGRRLAQLGH
ncbi:CDP-alcohol phosphatidyltransferase family protein [Novosphingobium pituita]|jgi:phosphatidylglycerophosphate synthase|uniref:CDP-alcohol phosphatidyltransferase family protein n=1 Tax=Novosphingobium pituita TaxID=3056842 RepID=UPI00295F2CBB|nr:CDP-alcohol phosphatidyltransferase family protein [Novosphingobium sp. IK01]MDK4806585.1 CDP-alcohol phosphatidyltransferase family protein [Novosphingobium aromaticivorans]